MEYICSCGKEFLTANSFNGHKCHCKVHQINKYGIEHFNRNAKLTNDSIHKAQSASMQARIAKKTERELAWQQTEHFCATCGKQMFEKFGSGRFCSRACANSHTRTEESKAKVSNSISVHHKLVDADLRQDRVNTYLANPNFCQQCGAVLPYDSRRNKTCSSECAALLRSSHIKQTKEVLGAHVEGRHIVYKITNDFDLRYYIGVRKTESVEFDGYLGSGVIIKRLVKKHGKEHFRRETLFEFSNSTEAFAKEKELLQEALLDTNCINIASGGQGGKTR